MAEFKNLLKESHKGYNNKRLQRVVMCPCCKLSYLENPVTSEFHRHCKYADFPRWNK